MGKSKESVESENQRSTESENQRSAESENQRSTESENHMNDDSSSNVRRSNRPKKNIDYNKLHNRGFTFHQSAEIDINKMHHQVVNKVIAELMNEEQKQSNDKTQAETLLFNFAVDKWGEMATECVIKEAAQLDDKRVMDPKFANELTDEDKIAALDSITFVTKKRCGKMKGRTVAGGHKQKNVPKTETSAATLSTEALMLEILRATHEERNIMVGDITGAYLNAYMPGKILMKFKGRMVNILISVNEKYKKFVTYEKGIKVIYVRLNKALYGTVQAALLWYKMLTSTLRGLGFILNPYDLCIANKTINGKQCTIAFYVDDLFCTHAEVKVLEEIRNKIEAEYGELSGVTFGDEHIFLGIDIKIVRSSKTAELRMTSHLQDAINDFEEINSLDSKEVVNPAKSKLFEVNRNAMKVSERKMAAFRSIVMKLLYVAKRVRIDILTTVSFLTSRQGVTDVDDWKKLRRLVQYIKCTLDMPLILGAERLDHFYTFIDVAYATNNDRKSHTGGCITFGRGAVHAKSSKQKLNAKSSTEGEIIGCSDYLSYPIWCTHYMQIQGEKKVSSHLFQDNKSAIRIEENG